MSILDLTPEQCRIGRAASGLAVAELAEAAGVPETEILSFESDRSVAPETAHRLAEALTQVGVTFFTTPDGRSRMRVMTLDGIIETPVTLSQGHATRH